MSLEIKNLCKSFDGKIIFSDFSYSFNETGIYAILGESGRGKTTLLRMICGLDEKYSGEIIGGGIGKTSVAFQEYRLFPTLSALMNLVCTVSDTPDDGTVAMAKSALSSLGFTENDMNLYPHELSGGMKQRVSLARALMFDAPILLIDEPTKELDAENTAKVVEAIKKEGEKRLVILVTHRPEDIDALSAKAIQL